jgi:hypothetical protein
MPDLKQALRDFVATSNSGKYSDEQTLLSKFPELNGYDTNSLKDSVATSKSGKYKTEDELNSKFPELFSVKKKEESKSTYQKNILELASQPKKRNTLLGTEPQKKVLESESLSGIPKTHKFGKVTTASNVNKDMKQFSGKLSDVDLYKMKSTNNLESNKIKKPKTDEDRDFIDYIADTIDVGIARVSKSIYDTPSLVYDTFSSVTNPIIEAGYKVTGNEDKFKPATSEGLGNLLGFENIPSKILKEKINGLNKKLEEQTVSYGGDPLTAIENGRYADAAKIVTGSTLQALPAVAIAIGTGGGYAGLAAIGITTASEKNAELEEQHPEISATARVSNSLASGALMATFGHVFTGAAGAVMSKILQAEGNAGAELIGNAFKNIAEKNIMKSPLVGVFGEALTFGAIDIGNQLNDMATGIRKELDVRQAFNSSITGIGMGLPGAVSVYGAKAYVSTKNYLKVVDTNKQIYYLTSEINKPETTESSKKILAIKADQLIQQNKRFLGGELEKLKHLSPEDKAMLNKTNKVVDEVKESIQKIKDSNELSPEALKIAKQELYKDYEEAVKKRREIFSKVKDINVEGDYSNFEGVPVDFDIEHNGIHSLPIEQQNSLNKQAFNELNSELNPTGKEQVDITKEMVSERANKIHKESTNTKENTVNIVKSSGQKVSDFINRPATLESFSGSKFEEPLKGDLFVEDQRVIFEDKNNKQYDLGNVDEIFSKEVEKLGISPEEKQFDVTKEGKISINGNEWDIQSELPTNGIDYDKEGNITAVSLKNKEGKTVMFDGQLAEDIGYQVLLSKAETDGQRERYNKIIEEDAEINRQLREAEKTSEEQTNTDTKSSIKEDTGRKQQTVTEKVTKETKKVSDDYVSLSNEESTLKESINSETNQRKKDRLQKKLDEVTKQKQSLIESDEKMKYINDNIDDLIKDLEKKGVGKPCNL